LNGGRLEWIWKRIASNPFHFDDVKGLFWPKEALYVDALLNEGIIVTNYYNFPRDPSITFIIHDSMCDISQEESKRLVYDNWIVCYHKTLDDKIYIGYDGQVALWFIDS
jgi:hypothetical protein